MKGKKMNEPGTKIQFAVFVIYLSLSSLMLGDEWQLFDES